MATRKTRKAATVTPPTQAELDARTRLAKMDTAPYMPQGNRPFSIFADETSEHGKSWMQTGTIYSRIA